MRDKAFDTGARFLKDTNPNANFNAFLAHWRRELGINQQEARDLYEDLTTEMKRLGISVADFNEFKQVAVSILDIPAIDPSTVEPNGRPASRS